MPVDRSTIMSLWYDDGMGNVILKHDRVSRGRTPRRTAVESIETTREHWELACTTNQPNVAARKNFSENLERTECNVHGVHIVRWWYSTIKFYNFIDPDRLSNSPVFTRSADEYLRELCTRVFFKFTVHFHYLRTEGIIGFEFADEYVLKFIGKVTTKTSPPSLIIIAGDSYRYNLSNKLKFEYCGF
jgi:hypothetical protein